MVVIEIHETETFAKWFKGLRDQRLKAVIAARLRRLAFGFFGDVKSVGDGIGELRFHQGPGYRIYFVRRGETYVLLLCGGDKGSQDRDIERAKAMAQTLEDFGP